MAPFRVGTTPPKMSSSIQVSVLRMELWQEPVKDICLEGDFSSSSGGRSSSSSGGGGGGGGGGGCCINKIKL